MQAAGPSPQSAMHVLLGKEFLRLNPSDGTVASRVPAMRGLEARRAANHAALAFPLWANAPAADRAAVLRRAADLIAAQSAALGKLMHDEIGATEVWQSFNLTQAVAQFRMAAEIAEGLDAAPQAMPDGSYVIREPAGVCLGIAPWNAPLALGARAIATGLACGNSMVLKASEICAGSHLALGQILAEAGLPAGVLSIVTHAPEYAEEVVRALIEHPAVRRVNFTGSTRVGRFVAEIAAHNLKRCLLELSGKAAQIVLRDADLEAAAEAAVYGAFLNQGQVCMSTDAILVEEAVADAFVALLKARTEALQAGPIGSGADQLGPMVSEAMAQRLSGLVADAVDKGAVLVTGGGREGSFIQPTVLDHVAPGMAVYTDECFGPLVGVCRVESAEEAISVANDSRYGLAAAIWSWDVPGALVLARQLEVGMCHINAPTLTDSARHPVGGIKHSGYGRFGGTAALDEFTETRWITVGQPGQDYRL